MTGAILLLTAAYVATAALLLTLSLATPYPRRVKALAIGLVSVLNAGAWWGFQGMTGWPSSQAMPEQFRVLWINIDERQRREDTPSAIYYWVKALDAAGLPVGPPRSFRRPWSEDAAEAAEAALSAMESGMQLNGSLSRSLMQADEDSAMLSDYAGELSVTGAAQGEISIRFTTAPARHLPPKQPPG